MRTYMDVLRNGDYRKLWVGAVISLLGDGATWTALAWIAVSAGGAQTLAVLGVCYSAPVLLGGVLAGKVVDRFSRRALLVFDSMVRAAAMAVVPLLYVLDMLSVWHLYVVAAVYGLFKILPIGIIPAVLPDIVPKKQLDTAIALEAVAYGAAGLAGPALGGLLIPLIGGHWVLAVDAATYLVFAGLVLTMKARLGRPEPDPKGTASAATADAWDAERNSWKPVLRFLAGDKVMLVITIAFTAFNMAMGMLIVTQPWLAHEKLTGGATMLGIIVGGLAAAEMIGSLIAGAVKPAVKPMVRIGLLQLVAGGGLLLLLGIHPALILIGQAACGIPAMLMTVSSQSVRYQRTPEVLRARTMTLMRTLMHSAVPVGSFVAGPLLAGGHYTALVVTMAAVAGAPGLLSLLFVRDDVINTPEQEATPGKDAGPEAGAFDPVEPAFDAETGKSGAVAPGSATELTLSGDAR
ncbi:MFS transporter [Streptomyces sp. NPDC054794]